MACTQHEYDQGQDGWITHDFGKCDGFQRGLQRTYSKEHYRSDQMIFIESYHPQGPWCVVDRAGLMDRWQQRAPKKAGPYETLPAAKAAYILIHAARG